MNADFAISIVGNMSLAASGLLRSKTTAARNQQAQSTHTVCIVLAISNQFSLLGSEDQQQSLESALPYFGLSLCGLLPLCMQTGSFVHEGAFMASM